VLKIKTRVKNTGKTSLPFGLGFHPYFKTSISFDESFLKMPPCQILPLDERMLPTTEVKNYLNASQEFQGKDLKLDDCFKLIEKTKGLFILKDPNTKNGLEISSKNLTYFQLYTPANRKSIAIEPMSCPPNVFNNKLDLLTIKPKEKYKFAWSIKGISKLQH
jgi:aldose 1-epimerase